MVPILLLLLLPLRTPASELYFSQSDLTVRIPYNQRNHGTSSWNLKLLELRTLRNNRTEPKNVEYSVTVPRDDTVSIDSETNSLLLLRRPPKRVESGYYTIVVLAKENPAGNEAVLEVKVHPILVDERINCTDYVQDMCFWNASRYKIYENQPSTMIGTFGPDVYSDVCPSFRVTGYKLLNGTEYFYVAKNALYANKSLDRDTLGPPPSGPGPRIKIQVQCVVWEETTGIQYAPIKHLDVDILDQDDNVPIAQGNDSVVITLGDFTVGDKLVDDNSLILTDADAEGSNRYVVHILGDTHNALNITYNTLQIEASKGVPYTAILPKIFAKTTLLPKSPYRVTIQVQDVYLLPEYGENTMNITLTFYGPEHRTTTTTVPSVPSRQQISYPSSVKVARVATRYSRVAKPSNEPHPSLRFSIQGSAAFAVTQKGGIIYVADEQLLDTEPNNLVLRIKWSGKDRAVVSSKAIRINLAAVSASKLDTCNRTQSEQENERLHSCANAETPEVCESSCGVASGLFSKGSFSGQCVWRWNKRSNEAAVMSDHYPTCSPDLTHCPDNRCDELEELDPRICPQDCILGTCACDDMLQCTCNVDRLPSRNDNSGRGNKDGRDDGKSRDRENEVLVSDARKASGGPCGPFCMIGAIGGSFFVLIAIVGSFVTSRYRMAAKGARRDGKRRTANGDANGIGILPSDYIDRGDGLLIGLDTFTAANRHLLLPKSCPPDPKWEFPRSRLTIEQVLGEGEFGRVLRAKAIDIGGGTGPMTVAVKTLKENACASELADLLSEYQLLKEAQHPNVIRLLGACTTPGAPVYLIIEFAEFGSLRNYLRRSRHLESDGRNGGGCLSLSNADEQSRVADVSSTYTVTPRDILSFAWQISKGMAYLADIKLVHRDLAARNVLLATGKVCKISDFGLTRDVYEDDAYLKRSKGRVPVKWMAPESLADHVYTSKSDVWSFGVLLWELVTLGASPYPGVDVHNLYNLLKAGYRMERPANCSPQLYKLMVSCWHQEPGSRPSFRELTSHWEKMLEDSVEYLDLNPRTVDNRSYFASLHALDSPSSSGNDEPDDTEEKTTTFANSVVNYLEKPSSDTVTKCDKVDKLHTLWQEPVTFFPVTEQRSKPKYVNDQRSNSRVNHYESPIKFRNPSVTSDSENDLATPTNERPQSYIDMEGKKCLETEDLLVFTSINDNNRGEDK
ncbi:PREDICTED: LOW QUALITY PROTEIN: proto-oncogene tyrosine-protein kinase receptor Ret [Dufourea novaeangliae]|uniref:LOW QUALITY PROTEIN: proto-oncogene tyrosine-protein kinase receptor Ret n=1 Tax=Dufourea novaeangliae TaxID=178035 RepID=UPI0007675027|nr:PREDICTED: LOW QUALITY PROTEIN: proto-oncogene tyrosine-protein kinase receptor Ret [Dufourea novaeangliae]